jgi:hypothetical protein
MLIITCHLPLTLPMTVAELTVTDLRAVMLTLKKGRYLQYRKGGGGGKPVHVSNSSGADMGDTHLHQLKARM